MTDGDHRPLVSVLIPLYNAGEYLAEAIDSVLCQGYEPMDIVIVDDGSADSSPQVAAKFGSRVRYERQPRSGIGATRNRTVALARGELLAFLDADDRYCAGKVARQVGLLQNPALDAVFGHVREFVSDELDSSARDQLRAPVARSPSHLVGTMMIRRSAFFRVGLFREDLALGEGLDWYARALESGLRSSMMADLVLERRLHRTNNGLRESANQAQYISIMRAALQRRRAHRPALGATQDQPAPGSSTRPAVDEQPVQAEPG